MLLNHILPTAEDSETLVSTAPADVTTLLGTSLSYSLVGEDLMVTPAGTTIASKVVTADVMTCAGVVHVVDKVLVPVVDSAEAPEAVAPTTDREFVADGPISAEEPLSVAEAPDSFLVGEYGDELAGGYGL